MTLLQLYHLGGHTTMKRKLECNRKRIPKNFYVWMVHGISSLMIHIALFPKSGLVRRVLFERIGYPSGLGILLLLIYSDFNVASIFFLHASNSFSCLLRRSTPWLLWNKNKITFILKILNNNSSKWQLYINLFFGREQFNMSIVQTCLQGLPMPIIRVVGMERSQKPRGHYKKKCFW